MENYGDYRRCQYCNQRKQTFNEPKIEPYLSESMMQQQYNDQMIGEPFSGQMPGGSFGGQMIGEPFSGQMPGGSFGGQMPGEPFGGQMPGQPFGGQMPGQPFGDQIPGQPFGGQMPGGPYDNQMMRQPFNNQMAGQPYNFSSSSALEQTPAPTPYYQMYGYPQMLMEEQENELDMDRIKEMYPEAARQILTLVEEECDKLEYEGSFMFDEHPDVNMLMKIRNDIYDNVKDNYDLEAEEENENEVYGMNWERSRRFPPNKNWLGDMIDVLFLNEMFRRRCRFRNCCGRWC